MGKKRNLYIDTFDPKNIHYYYGIPNCYTAFSTGKGTPYDALTYGDNAGLDFMSITDLNSYLGTTISTTDGLLTKWQATKYFINRFEKKHDDFLPLIGFECKTNSIGDLNIINSNSYFTGFVRDLKLLALWMLNHEESIITIRTPPVTFKPLPYNLILNKLITCVDVGASHQSAKSTLYEKYYYYMLDAGWRLGAINGQNTQKLQLGETENLTVYIGNELSTDELVAAFRNRRTYSTQSRFLKLHFTINGAFMGENIIIQPNEKLKFNIYAEDYKFNIQEIQIITSKGLILRKIDGINLSYIKYIYEYTPSNNEKWYLIKLIQDDGRIAISSPIFISYDEIE